MERMLALNAETRSLVLARDLANWVREEGEKAPSGPLRACGLQNPGLRDPTSRVGS